ncbi:MAG TPA: carboxypeptidase regulatory-like domain-containing protein [Bacteroidota bacterium]|jgi:hypothetical protein|nr:carboxypeptidase regulatory-like domain-containing protein [Bacteroidota bacterium]
MEQFKRVHLILFFMLSIIGALFGQAPPRELEGRFIDDDHLVELRWDDPDDQHPMFYNVYRKAVDETSFHVISTPADDRFDDQHITSNSTYAYYVTAVYVGNLESAPTNTIGISTSPDSLEDSNDVAIHFTTSPVPFSLLGQTYSYDAHAETSPAGMSICFSLEEGPPGMTINPSTGLIQWTPTSLGVFEVEIEARVCSGSGEDEAEQRFHVMVTSESPGQIVGTVRETSGHSIPHAKIKIFDVSAGVFILRTFTDSAGHYTFPIVNPGSYFVRAHPEEGDFEDQWFDGVKRMEDATPVTVDAAETITVDFTLHHENEIERDFHLSGTVRDTMNAPIAGARVFAFRQEDNDDFDDLFDDHQEGHRRRHDHDRTALSDSDGNYLLTLRGGLYIVGAKKEGYSTQFWDHQPSPLEANVIGLHQDTTNINFDLISTPAGNGSISGYIRSALDSTGLESHVIGFQQDAAGGFTGVKAFAESDSTGAYSLHHLPDGSYIVLAKDGHDFIPTFYSVTGGSPLISDASPVLVNGNAVMNIDIFVQPDSSEGLNAVEGEVESESGGTAMSKETSSPLGGVLVTLLGRSAQAIGAAITGADGSYHILGLSPGTYTAVFQKPGSSTAIRQTSVFYIANAPGTATLDARLEYASNVEVEKALTIRENWNLVSVPVTVLDYARSTIFPDAISGAFAYRGSYTSVGMLENGEGYWMKFPATQNSTILVHGLPLLSRIVDVQPGWNLVGSVSTSVPVSGVASIPAGTVTSQFFGYQGSYVPADVIEPGKGYWVKVSSACKLVLSGDAAMNGAAELIRVVPTTEMPPDPPDGSQPVRQTVPLRFALEQNYPNPFNPVTTLRFALPATSVVTLSVYNVVGQQTATLLDRKEMAAGFAEVTFDASNLPSGLYFYRISARTLSSSGGSGQTFSRVEKMMLLK